MSLSDVANDLRIHVNALGNAVIDSFRRDLNATRQLLEKYPVEVLEQVNQRVKTEQHAMYEIIMKRRMAYIERERAKYRKRLEQGMQPPTNESKWIDFRGDPDDTQNLTCGMGVLSKYIDTIDEIIASKTHRNHQSAEKFNLHQMTCIILSIIPLLIFYLFTKS